MELRVWFPWRVALLVLAGLGIFALVYVPWRLSGVNQLGPLVLGSMSLWLIVVLLATVSLSEGTVLGDIERGTASWLVAMPIGRPAVITAKFAASSAGVATAVFATGAALYPVLRSASKTGVTQFRVDELIEVTASPIGKWGVFISLPDAWTFTAMLSAIALCATFLVALMILFGTAARSRTIVFGLGLVSFGILVAGWFAAGETLVASPVGLVGAVSEGIQDREVSIGAPAVATVLMSVALVATASWRFQRRDLA